MKTIYRVMTVILFLFFSSSAGFAASALSEDQVFPLRVPIRSPLFAKTPVAMVEDQPVFLGDVTAEMKSVLDEKSARKDGKALTRKFNQVLDRLLAERLKGKDEKNAVVYADRTIGKDLILTVRVPIFLPQFIFTPVASVNDEPIPMGEFTRDLGSMHAEMEKPVEGEDHHDTPASLLDRLVTVRLVEQEARNIGIGQTPAFQKQVEAFAEKTLLYELLGLQVDGLELDREKADTIYHDISLAAKLRTYRFEKQEDAVAFLKQLEGGADFEKSVREQIEKGKAVGGEDEGYVPFKDLISQVASAANSMEIGEVSKVYQMSDGYVIFKLEDRKFVEDPEALQVAEKITWDQQVAEKSKEYINEIISKYATFDDEARKDFNFTRIKEQSPEIKLSEALMKFSTDQRVLASVQGRDQIVTMKVDELAGKLKDTYFHGTEIDLNASEADKRVDQILNDWIFRIAGKIEAESLGLHQSQRYQVKLEEFERRTLFDNFIQKAIVNGIKLKEEEVRQYYESHQHEYSTPSMFRMRSLAFRDEAKAREALKKLKSGSDFKWVSANSEGLAQVEDKDLLSFDSGILSLTSLPPAFQKDAEAVQAGDSILYSDPGNFHYVIYFEKVFPPQPKPYDQVRSQILKEVYRNRVDSALDDYVQKLKEHYPAEIYLSFEGV